MEIVMIAPLRNEVKAGLFVVVAVFLFVASIFVMGRERHLFQRQFSYFAHFQDVKGLQEGAPVRLGGIGIGRVEDVSFTPDEHHNGVRVTLHINEAFHARLHTDAKAIIETQGLLGDRFINILGGSTSDIIPEGGIIESVEPTDLGAMADEVKKIAERSQAALDHFDQMLVTLNDTTLSELALTSRGVRQAVEAVNTGSGFLHALLYSEDLSTSLGTTFKNISTTSDALRRGESALSRLIFDKKLGHSFQEGLDSASRASTNLSGLLEELGRSKGFLKSLFAPEGSPSSSTFADILEDTKQITRALASGRGTLGAFIMDSKVYDNLTEVTDEAKRSTLLRYAIRSSVEK
jgi:phospholipid/cholesterol/gamma-HCH transport system substrate-binding protein